VRWWWRYRHRAEEVNSPKSLWYLYILRRDWDVCSHFSELLWFSTFGTSGFRIATCFLQSNALNCVTIWLLVMVPFRSFYCCANMPSFHSNCLMLLCLAFFVGRIRVLVHSERNQLSKSVIASLFKQRLGSLQVKLETLVMYLWMPFIFSSIVFLQRAAVAWETFTYRFLLALI